MQKQAQPNKEEKQQSAGVKTNPQPNKGYEKPGRIEEETYEEDDDGVEQAPKPEKEVVQKKNEQNGKGSKN